MSIPRLLGIIALALFIIFVASFFTVLIRLSRIGVVTERAVLIKAEEAQGEEIARTRFDITGQSPDSGRLQVEINTRIDIREFPFSELRDGDVLKLRIRNLVPELERNTDLDAVFHDPPAGENFVNLNFGRVDWDILDRRDFYPLDGYGMSFNFAFYVKYHSPDVPAVEGTSEISEIPPVFAGEDRFVNETVAPPPELPGTWFQPKAAEIRSLTNMILLNARYGPTGTVGDIGFRVRVARLRILQYFTVTLILIEVLFIIYLLTIINLQELLAKGLGYLVGLFIVREILVTHAPQFPTLVDYSTLFLICVVFFLMLFKFLGGAEEHALITIPPGWHDALMGQNKAKSPKDRDVEQ